MKKLLIATLLSVTTSSFATITLTPINHVALVDVISSASVSHTILAIEKSKEPITYLFIDSPGGSVIDGLVLVNYLQLTKKNIVCVAKYAASMAHAILESCPKRIGLESNILMQHKISTGVEGPIGEIEGTLNIIKGLSHLLDSMEAKRIGISEEEFARRTSGPYYTFGQESLKQNLLDGIEQVTCAPELYSISKEKTVTTIFGAVIVTTNGCPLIPVVVRDAEPR